MFHFLYAWEKTLVLSSLGNKGALPRLDREGPSQLISALRYLSIILKHFLNGIFPDLVRMALAQKLKHHH